MARPMIKTVGVSWTVPEKAKQTLDRQATARGIPTTQWIGQIFDMGFAAVCAREKSMPITDADLDAIVGATLFLRKQQNWDYDKIAKAMGVSVPTVKNILQGWRQYRRAQ